MGVYMGKINKKKKDNTTKIIGITSLMGVVLVGVVVFQFILFQNLNSTSVIGGDTINGVNLSGKTEAEAVTYLDNYFSDKADDFELTLCYNDKSYLITAEDIEVTSDIHTILEQMQIHKKQTDSYAKKTTLLKNLTSKGESINIAINSVFVGLDNKINEIVETIEKEPINSVITFSPNEKEMFKISEQETGLKVDKEKLYQQINEQYLKHNKFVLDIPTTIVEPEITMEYNQNLTNIISKFSTSVGDSTGGRKHNVSLALSKFNGLVVAPNESISFNNITCPHTTLNGYQNATIILNGRFVDGVGGGICQASTTLYNALVNAGIQIDEVNKHTLPVKYVPLALDAMVSGNSDLKFTNNLGYPIFIKTYSDSESVTVEVFSHKNENGYSYKTRSETIQTLPHLGDIVQIDNLGEYEDKVLYKGEQYRLTYPRDGFEAISYIDTYNLDGELIEEKQLRHEIYKPQNGIIIEGAKLKPTEFNDANQLEKPIDANENLTAFNQNISSFIPSMLCP